MIRAKDCLIAKIAQASVSSVRFLTVCKRRYLKRCISVSINQRTLGPCTFGKEFNEEIMK